MSDTCIFHCDAGTPSSSEFNCGLSRDCYFHCEDNQCLKGGHLNATSSQTLYAYSSRDLCYEDAHVQTAQRNSYFDINAMDKREFKKLIIDASNSESIFVNCTSIGDESCRQITVNAQTASYVEIFDRGTSGLQDATVYCPQNSNYNGPNAAPCILDFGGSTIEKGAFHTIDGIPKDIMIYAAELKGDITIFCEDGTSKNILNSFENTDCWITNAPTTDPTRHPTSSPTIDPSVDPTHSPTIHPSTNPSVQPSIKPTINPSLFPTYNPTLNPSFKPTVYPTKTPSAKPTLSPTKTPSVDPTVPPTKIPSTQPTDSPTGQPSTDPTLSPTKTPSINPTLHPTSNPSTKPTLHPTSNPSANPTLNPTNIPSARPTLLIKAKVSPNPTAKEGHVVLLTTQTESQSTESSIQTHSGENTRTIWDMVDIKSIIILILLAIVCALCVFYCISKWRRK
eukprot:59385_1